MHSAKTNAPSFFKEVFLWHQFTNVVKLGRQVCLSILTAYTRKKTKSGFITKTEANRWAVEIESQRNNSTLPTKDGIISEMFKEWYLVFKEP